MDLKQRIEQKVNKNHESEIKSNVVLESAVEYQQAEENKDMTGGLFPAEEKTEILCNVPQVEVSIEEAKQRIMQLQQFIKTMMVKDIDFGLVPGCNKPTLFKPGAEKLADIYGLSKRVEITNRIEDFEQGLFHYEVKVTLINKRTGMIEAEGLGSCNNREKKFIKLDAFSVVNNVLKMAKKRAIVDGVLSATRTSGIFSQDIDGNTKSA